MWKCENWLIDLRRRSRIPYHFFRNGFDHLAKFWQKLRCADWDGWWLLWSGNWKELPVERLQTRWFRLALLIVNERQILILQSFALHCTFHILGLKLMKSNRRVVSAPVTRCLSTFCRNVHENLARILWLLFTAKLINAIFTENDREQACGWPTISTAHQRGKPGKQC